MVYNLIIGGVILLAVLFIWAAASVDMSEVGREIGGFAGEVVKGYREVVP